MKKIPVRFLIFIILGVAILAAVVVAYNQLSTYEYKKVESEKIFLQKMMLQKITLKETEINLIGRSLVLFYENSATVTSDEYDSFVKNMLIEIPEINNIFYLKNDEILQSYPHKEFINSKFDSLFPTNRILIDGSESITSDYVIDDNQRIVIVFPFKMLLTGETILRDNYKLILYDPLNPKDIAYQTGIINGRAITEPITFSSQELDSAIRVQKQTNFFSVKINQNYVLDYLVWDDALETDIDNFAQMSIVSGFIFAIIVPLLLIQTERYRNSAIKQSKTLDKINKHLIDIDKQKGEFSSMMAHELKTPLVPILGNVDYLKNPKMIDKLDSIQLEAINSIEKNAKRLELLISDLLDVQKLHLNKMKFTKSALNVKEFMESVKVNLSHYVKEKQIIFENITSDSFELVTDENRLRQVFGNLVKNSVDFVPSGGKIEIGASVSDSNALFFVKDNGVGITKEEQGHLFKKFYQADTTIRRKHGGTGLGLAICKGIVEGLGGKIWFESNQNKGTIFFFTLPLEGQKVEVKYQ